MSSGTILKEASHQWASRPSDQRFLSLSDLKAHVEKRKHESWTAAPAVKDLQIKAPETGNSLTVELFDPTIGDRREVAPTNFSFGQLAGYAKAPAAYLRGLPAALAAINLQWGLDNNPQRDSALILGQSNGDHTLRAITSESYGRIWDIEVVEAVDKANANGRWQIPYATYQKDNPKRATTLYASDRDVFIFLVDPKNEITVPGLDKPFYRGFYVWNSEVGAGTFGLTTFIYNTVCDNRTIWGATDVQELRIRHTAGAPKRFEYEGAKYLNRYSNESAVGIVDTIKKATEKVIDVADRSRKGIANWLQERGFTKGVAAASVDAAFAEEGDARTLWQIVQGVTAHARSVSNQDDRTSLESAAGKLLLAA